MTCITKRKTPAPPTDLHLQNRVSALIENERLEVVSNEASGLAEPNLPRSTRKKL